MESRDLRYLLEILVSGSGIQIGACVDCRRILVFQVLGTLDFLKQYFRVYDIADIFIWTSGIA